MAHQSPKRARPKWGPWFWRPDSDAANNWDCYVRERKITNTANKIVVEEQREYRRRKGGK